MCVCVCVCYFFSVVVVCREIGGNLRDEDNGMLNYVVRFIGCVEQSPVFHHFIAVVQN